MNKLLGFYELKNSSLPTIPWREFDSSVSLSGNRLWTIRSAVYHGKDISLPRLVGATASEAYDFAVDLKRRMGENGIVIYYPYFLAEKSGTMAVYWDCFIVEAVRGDLWKLVAESDCDVTIKFAYEGMDISGDVALLSAVQIEYLKSQVGKIRYMFRDDLLEGKGALLEWSFAYDCDSNKEKQGSEFLVFYEARTI